MRDNTEENNPKVFSTPSSLGRKHEKRLTAIEHSFVKIEKLIALSCDCLDFRKD